MELICNELCDNIFKRKSTRTFSNTALKYTDRIKLLSYAEKINNIAEFMRIIIIESRSGIYKGLVGSYGIIKNADKYAVFIGKSNNLKSEYEIGYFGEAFILAAVSNGIGTCWINGSYNQGEVLKDVSIQEGERIFAIVPIGYPADSEAYSHKLMKLLIKSSRRKTIEEISNINELTEKHDWMISSAEALRAAPSSRNIQPWFIKFGKYGIHLFDGREFDSNNKSMKIEFGIAMLHIELGAYKKGILGNWIYPCREGEARFEIIRYIE